MAVATESIIKTSPMSRYQFLLVALCCFTYAADGVDVASLAYAAPVLAKEWGIKPQMLGLALSATPIGLAIGCFLIAPLADRVGRRTVTLWSIGVVSLALFATAFSTSLHMLMALRCITGIGLGALVVCLNVTVSEFSNDRWRNVFVGVLHTGYSIGGMICATLAALLLEPVGWRSIFLVAGALTLVSFLLSLLLLVESPDYLLSRRPKNALERLNGIYRRFGHSPMEVLPARPEGERARKNLGALLTPSARTLTFLLCLAGFTFTLVGAFLGHWKPQILVNSGLTPFWASISGITAGAAGLLSHLTAGALARKVGEARLAVIALILMGIALIIFGLMPKGDIVLLLGMAAVTTFFNVGAQTCLVLVGLTTFAPEVRTLGLGFQMGFARIGGIAGPMAGGLALGAGLERNAVFLLFATFLVIPVLAVLAVGRRRAKAAAVTAPAMA